MTVVSNVQTAWADNVFAHDTVIALTPNSHPFEVTVDSEFELKRLFFQKKINYFEYVVTAKENFPQIGSALTQALYDVTVEIRYTLEKDTTGDTYQTARSVPNTILNLVASELGENWDSTVDFFNYTPTPINVLSDRILETPVWRVVFTYSAQIFTTLS